MSTIRCGPIVRRVTRGAVSVFLVLDQSAEVALSVVDDSGRSLLDGRRRTIELGKDAHAVVVTARTDGDALEWGARYGYELAADGEALALPTYPGVDRPAFTLPTENPKRRSLVHGSCRRPGGGEYDALAWLDDRIVKSLTRDDWPTPQQLVLSGDQIYADDVHPKLFAGVEAEAEGLHGEAERAELVEHVLRLREGKRQKLITADADLSSDKADNHLVTLGEFYAMYLLAWSDEPWRRRAVSTGGALGAFVETLPAVRRALAHTPTLMLFDDHEVTDDWNLTGKWCAEALANPLARRIMRNGLAAYAVFQHWGNDPEAFEGTTTGAQLLRALDGWKGDAGRAEVIERLLRLPKPGEPHHDPPATAIDWGWRVDGPNYTLVALDTRTRRAFHDFPDTSLMTEAHIDEALDAPREDLLILVSPAPVLGQQNVEALQADKRRARKIREFDCEAWFMSPTFEYLRDRLLATGPVVALSGDVHYGFGTSLTDTDTGGKLVNFTASPLCNETPWLLELVNAFFSPANVGSVDTLKGGATDEPVIAIEAAPVKGRHQADVLGEELPAEGPATLGREDRVTYLVRAPNIGELRWEGRGMAQYLWYRHRRGWRCQIQRAMLPG